MRELDPGPTGIPLQIHAYTAGTDFVPHENVQSDIFEHLIAILPEFGLSLFQQPAGIDLRAAFARPRNEAAWLATGGDTRKRVSMV